MEHVEELIRNEVHDLHLSRAAAEGSEEKLPTNLFAQQGSTVYIWKHESSELVMLDLLQHSGKEAVRSSLHIKRQVDFPVSQIHINAPGTLLALVSDYSVEVCDLYVRTGPESKELNVSTCTQGIRQVLWHPFSPHALFVLTTSTLECYQFEDVNEPELKLTLPSIAAPEKDVVSFCFGGGEGWERLTLFVLHADTTVSSFCPVIPNSSLLPRSLLDDLKHRASAQDEGGDADGESVASWVERLITLASAQQQQPRAGTADEEEPSADEILSLSLPAIEPPGCIGPYEQLPQRHDYEDDAVCITSGVAGECELLFILTREGRVYIQMLGGAVAPEWTTDSTRTPEMFTLEVVELQLEEGAAAHALEFSQHKRAVVVWHSHGVHVVSLNPYFQKLKDGELGAGEIKSDIFYLHRQQERSALLGHALWTRMTQTSTILLYHNPDTGACNVALKRLLVLESQQLEPSHNAYFTDQQLAKVRAEDDAVAQSLRELKPEALRPATAPTTPEEAAVLTQAAVDHVRTVVAPALQRARAYLEKRRERQDAVLADLKRATASARKRAKAALDTQCKQHNAALRINLALDTAVDQSELIYIDLNSRTPALSDAERALKRRLSELTQSARRFQRRVNALQQSFKSRGHRAAHQQAAMHIDPSQLTLYLDRMNKQGAAIQHLQQEVNGLRQSLCLDD